MRRKDSWSVFLTMVEVSEYIKGTLRRRNSNLFLRVRVSGVDYEQIYFLDHSLCNKILHLAFRGHLVPQNEDDEPANELLSRIGKDITSLQSRSI